MIEQRAVGLIITPGAWMSLPASRLQHDGKIITADLEEMKTP
jgi:23S rRNA U2552 (ribose-2'-O)-methylase RlmE/FtsJ